MYYATKEPHNSVSLEGHVNGPDKDKYTITIEGAMGAIRPDINGNVQKIIPIDVEEVDIKVGKAGAVDTLVVYPAKRQNGKLSFGEYPQPPPSLTPNRPRAEPTPSATPTPFSAQVAGTPTGFPTPLFQK